MPPTACVSSNAASTRRPEGAAVETNTEYQEKDLFISIFRQISGNETPVPGILRETCQFFGFYSGFVYEADHNGIFHLRENYLRRSEQLRARFQLSDYLTPKDIRDLIKKSGEIVYLNSRKNRLGMKFLTRKNCLVSMRR